MMSHRPEAIGAPAQSAWSRPMRIVASLAIAFHLAAVVVPPMAGPPPASELASAIREPLRPYVGALHLGHGYRFFAPDPGPGHSIRWTITRADGTTVSGVIPDAAADRPRLLYHRRFMVSEKIAALVPTVEAPAEARARAKEEWQPLVMNVAAHLLRKAGGKEVRLDLVEHYLPTPEESRGRAAGTDLVTPLGRYGWAAGAAP